VLTWAHVEARIRGEQLRALTVLKSEIPHPRDAGATAGIGLPRGQLSDWRFPALADCSSMHVSEFAGVWSAHVDAKHPACDPIGHVRDDVLPAIVRTLKAASVVAAEAWSRTASAADHRVAPALRPGCRGALVLVAVDTDPLSLAIDDLTGALGWSHVYLDPCVSIAGKPAILDFTVRRGVHWSSPDAYAKRERRRIELDPQTAAETIACAQARIRQPLSIETFGIDEPINCVGMIVACLPWHAQEQLRALQVGPCVSPNTLAAFFGVQ
jgi:hypothetical protein